LVLFGIVKTKNVLMNFFLEAMGVVAKK
jgi:hypothetical protein